MPKKEIKYETVIDNINRELYKRNLTKITSDSGVFLSIIIGMVDSINEVLKEDSDDNG